MRSIDARGFGRVNRPAGFVDIGVRDRDIDGMVKSRFAPKSKKSSTRGIGFSRVLHA